LECLGLTLGLIWTHLDSVGSIWILMDPPDLDSLRFIFGLKTLQTSPDLLTDWDLTRGAPRPAGLLSNAPPPTFNDMKKPNAHRTGTALRGELFFSVCHVSCKSGARLIRILREPPTKFSESVHSGRIQDFCRGNELLAREGLTATPAMP